MEFSHESEIVRADEEGTGGSSCQCGGPTSGGSNGDARRDHRQTGPLRRTPQLPSWRRSFVCGNPSEDCIRATRIPARAAASQLGPPPREGAVPPPARGRDFARASPVLDEQGFCLPPCLAALDGPGATENANTGPRSLPPSPQGCLHVEPMRSPRGMTRLG
jgi:hypothetical protein